MSFLSTQVSAPDEDDHKKLTKVMKYLPATKDLPLCLKCRDEGMIWWWVDASYASHPNMKDHTRMTMSMGEGSIYSNSTKQKLVSWSSTESELMHCPNAMDTQFFNWTRLYGQRQHIISRLQKCYSAQGKWPQIQHKTDQTCCHSAFFHSRMY